MMRLAYPLFEDALELVENQVHVIILERPRLFREFYDDCLAAQSGTSSDVCLSKNFTPVAFGKQAELLSPPYKLDFSQRKIINKLYALLEQEAHAESLYMKTTELSSVLAQFLHELVLSSQLPLTFDEVGLAAIFKGANLQIEQEDSLIDVLCTYLDLMWDFFNIRIFVFFHLKEYLEPEEVAMLYQHCHYQKFLLVLVESRVHSQLPTEKYTIIDVDLCQIT